jgi:hypothetical protein
MTAPAETTDSRTQYQRGKEARLQEAARHAKLHARWKKTRNVAFGVLVGVAWLAEKERLLPLLLALPVLLFLTFLFLRNRAAVAWHRAAQAAAYFAQRIDWLDGRWAGRGKTGPQHLDETHPYALDLGLFESGGVYEYLCTARTSMGEVTLAAWLLSPAPPEEVLERQAAVAELRPLLALREEIAYLGSQAPGGIDPEALAAWAKAPPVPAPRGVRFATGMVVALTLAALGIGLFGAGPGPLLLALLLQGGMVLWGHQFARAVLLPVEQAGPFMTGLAPILARLEKEHFVCPCLHRLGAGLEVGGRFSSQRVAHLGRLLSCWPLMGLLLLTPQLALAIEAWRRSWGPALAEWLAAVGSFEALGALATYSFEHPEDPFPEMLAGGPCFEAEGLGHPLLPRDRCVGNDLHLTATHSALVVSGSNMAGKSTLLRSVGVNAVLAQAGAPVRARRLRLSPLMLGATLRVQDSLQAGRSRFYAELLRLRRLIDLARGPVPLLFLLDELLEGTNSQDRRVGAEALLRGLLSLGAMGLVTTHDLALTQIADLLAPRAANVHFEDTVEDGKMSFDYKLRPGIAEHSNALALMRAVGIDV